MPLSSARCVVISLQSALDRRRIVKESGRISGLDAAAAGPPCSQRSPPKRLPMKRSISALLVLMFAALFAAPLVAEEPPATAGPVDGQPAPDFKLEDQHAKWHTLADHSGKWVVLYFYPKDFTPGCTKEVCTFRDDVIALQKAGADVLGVSLDDVKSHADFAEKYHVPFPLLSDNKQEAAKAYGVLTSKMGMSYAKRETFLIDPHGKVAKHYRDVDPEKNSKQVLADLAALSKSAG
jgi:peroxiredoxin Q/BCP